MEIKSPYLLFLGDAADMLAAKTAIGIRDWSPDRALGQFRLDGCNADLGLDDLTVEDAATRGARTLVIGVANRGGIVGPGWMPTLRQSLESGLDIAAGMHQRLAEIPELRELAERHGRRIFDVRHPSPQPSKVGNGRPRPGMRLLTVGTDCSCGKMYATLAIHREMTSRGMDADFRATGQTGILISGSGISVDAVISDFISGAVEALSPEAAPEHWDLIEGQGSLFHASYAGVTTGLIHGAQADALVLCHEPTRTHMRGLPHFPLPSIDACLDRCLATAHLTNPDARFAGIAVNTSALDRNEALACIGEIEAKHQLPTTDPIRFGAGPLVDALA